MFGGLALKGTGITGTIGSVVLIDILTLYCSDNFIIFTRFNTSEYNVEVVVLDV